MACHARWLATGLDRSVGMQLSEGTFAQSGIPVSLERFDMRSTRLQIYPAQSWTKDALICRVQGAILSRSGRACCLTFPRKPSLSLRVTLYVRTAGADAALAPRTLVVLSTVTTRSDCFLASCHGVGRCGCRW